MDVFVEQIVAKKKGAKEFAVITLVLLGVAVVAALCFLFFGLLYLFAPLLLVGTGYGAWWLITNQNVEFEYCVTNGDIDVDQIIARRKRKRIVSVRGSKVEAAGRYVPAQWENRKIDRFVMAAPSLNEDGLFYFTYHSKKSGFTVVVFKPDERVQTAFYKGLPRLVQLDWDKNK